MARNTAPTYEELLSLSQRQAKQIDNLVNQLRELKRHVFGRKSEKLSVINTNQQHLFATELPVVEVEETPVRSHKRTQATGRKPIPADIPRERIEYEPKELECSCCGKELVKIGEDISEELDYMPARFIAREHVRIKRACKKCKGQVVTGTLPPDVQVIEKGRPGAGLLAHIFVAKYCDAQPLNRLEQMFARHKVHLSRSTMCDWVRQGANLLEPIANEIHRQILLSPAISADETTLKAQTPDRQGLHTGYLWGALGPPGVYFRYSKSRSSEVATELLKDYRGFVHTDAYAGYNKVFLPKTCNRVGCFAHVRRKFIEVQGSAGKEVGKILNLISQLYKIEKQIRKLTPDERVEIRQKKSVPLLAKLKGFLDALNESTLPRTPLKNPLEYTLKQWKELTIYAENGLLEIDNNNIERQIRPIAIGRKNYLFAGSHDGGRRAAIMYTIINTCKIHKVNPYDYLVDVLRRVHVHSSKRVDELTPLGWKAKFA